MLKVCNLTKKTPTGEILKDLSFEAQSGEITAVIGASGSGKTTLLRCLAQLDKNISGKMSLDEQDLSSLSHGEIGLVFQSFHLFPHLNILENLTLAPMHQGISKIDAEKNAYKLLDQFSLKAKAYRYPGQLSGGQKQRVAIARALIMNPPILLFDEPTSALDPEMVNEVGDIIKSLQDPKRVIMLVTHEIRLAEKVANRILFLDHGYLLDNMEASQFFEKDQSKLSKRAQKFLSNLS
jgi:ABC-type polar amino acid transport system ATPase subunit